MLVSLASLVRYGCIYDLSKSYKDGRINSIKLVTVNVNLFVVHANISFILLIHKIAQRSLW